MFELIILFLSGIVTIGVVIAFGVFNLISNKKAEAKDRNRHIVRYRPIIPDKPTVTKKEPAPVVVKEPEEKSLTVEEFVKKNLNLIDKLLQKKETFTLSEELLKDLNANGKVRLADWFMNMANVDTVVNNQTTFKVYM